MTEPAAVEASEAVTTEAAPEVVETVVPEAAPAPTTEELKKETPQERGARSKAKLMAKYDERTKSAAASDRAAEQPRVPEGTAEGGEFTKDGTVTPEVETVSEPSPDAPAAEVPEVPAEGVVEDPATPPDGATPPERAVTPPAEGYVRVQLGADHPLRDRAREHFDVPADQERDLRAVLQDHTRRRDVQSANQQLSEARAQLAESRADTDYWKSLAGTGGVLTPKQQQVYQDLLQAEGYGQEEADAYRQGIISQASTEGRDQALADARVRHAAEGAQNQAYQFQQKVLNDSLRGGADRNGAPVGPKYPHWTESEVRYALSGYGSICDARGIRPTPNGWYAYADVAYQSNPTVRSYLVVEQAKDRETIAEQAKVKATADATAKEAVAMKEAATRHSTRPGHVPSTASAGVRDLGTPDEEADLKKMSPGKQKKARHKRIMDRFARGRT